MRSLNYNDDGTSELCYQYEYNEQNRLAKEIREINDGTTRSIGSLIYKYYEH